MSGAGGIIALLRHGDTGQRGFRGRLDDPLTAAGWEQMEAALDLSGPWHAVVSSPLRRCAAFAENFAWRHGVPLRLDARLAELDFGRWEGTTAAELMEREPKALGAFWRDPWRNPPPEGESVATLEARVLAAWRAMTRELYSPQSGGHRDGLCRPQLAEHRGAFCGPRDGGHMLVITHGGVIRTLLRLARNLPRTELLAIEVPHASLHWLDTASIPDLGKIPCPTSARS